jgi:hypothetical protein
MSLNEESPLVGPNKSNTSSSLQCDGKDDGFFSALRSSSVTRPRWLWLVMIAVLVLSVSSTIIMAGLLIYQRHHPFYSGPYKLIELQEGHGLLSHYTFRKGPDSIGSAGFNTYVSFQRAKQLGILDVKQDKKDGKDYVYMKSAPPTEQNNKRESIRLEGKTRFDKGLFILDVNHMPTGCGVWPACWLTDERVWPDHGEIDILESINAQVVAKTAVHTGKECSMYGYVSEYDQTGKWDNATQIPNTISGDTNNVSIVEADNCWVKAPHQWRNQGCVAVSSENMEEESMSLNGIPSMATSSLGSLNVPRCQPI